jgi:methionine aminotransferase
MSQTRLKPLPTHGSYFQIYSYEGLSNQTEKEFAIYLTENFGVATIPVASFYQTDVNNQVLRFCFSKKEETLDAAIERLLKL